MTQYPKLRRIPEVCEDDLVCFTVGFTVGKLVDFARDDTLFDDWSEALAFAFNEEASLSHPFGIWMHRAGKRTLVDIVYNQEVFKLWATAINDELPASCQYFITFNNTGIKEACAVCGMDFHPYVGPELFIKSKGPVCSQCSEKHAPPEITAALKRAREEAEPKAHQQKEIQNVEIL